jgi:signal transduction histidine kinase
LFLVAVLFPSAVLVALGLRIISQEHELAEQRVADDRRRAVIDIRDLLLAELDRLRLETLTDLRDSPSNLRVYAYPAVRLVARIESGAVIPPWDQSHATHAARASLAEAAFAREIERGALAEMGRQDFATGIEAYRTAERTARDKVQLEFAHLMLARALAGAGRKDDAAQLRETMLALSSSVVDDVGVPFSFYAAMGLLESGGAPDRVQRWMKDELDRNIWRGPVATYLLRDVVAGIVRTRGDSTEHRESCQLADRVDDEIALVELQRQFQMLRLFSNDDGAATAGAAWVLFDNDQWLVGIVSIETEQDTLIALDTAVVLASVSRASADTHAALPRFEFTRDAATADGLLGQRLPGLGVIFLEDPSAAVGGAVGPQRAGYLGILGLVISVTLFGGYLLLRDVRRETRIAALRSHFVSSVSHELKTPLTSIRMFAETLRMRGATDPSTHAEYLDTIVGESERLTRLLNNVLDHSQIEQDRKIYHSTTTSLPEIVNRAAAAMEYPLSQGGFTLQVDPDEGVPSSTALAAFSQPSAARSTILARRTSRTGVRRPFDHRSRTILSSSDTVSAGATRDMYA